MESNTSVVTLVSACSIFEASSVCATVTFCISEESSISGSAFNINAFNTGSSELKTNWDVGVVVFLLPSLLFENIFIPGIVWFNIFFKKL